VGEACELLLRGLDEPRVRVADVQTADPAGEIDERVAVDVGQRRTVGLGDEDRMDKRERCRDDTLLALGDLPGARPGDLRANLD
jgi:hypothetical protein